ncbi:hypothetical protein J6590_086338 [Homalodisca vitripennis]|nr:hypothetical protein J6590_086338 [Homalodisca vitripennis]
MAYEQIPSQKQFNQYSLHNVTARLHRGLSFQKLYGPQNTAPTINHCPHRNCENTPRPLVPEAIRTATHCPYHQPLSTSKLRDYTLASRSRSYTDRKTLPLQSTTVHIETARIHPGLSFQKLYGPQNTASTTTSKLRDYTQATHSRIYTDRKTLPLQSTTVHIETARIHPGLSFQKLYGPQNTAPTINHCPHRNCENTPRPLVPEAIRTAKHCAYNQPLSTSKLREYTQASRSRSYTDHKTLPLQSSNRVRTPGEHIRSMMRILVSPTTRGCDVCKPGAILMNVTDLSPLSSGSCCFFIPSPVASG